MSGRGLAPSLGCDGYAEAASLAGAYLAKNKVEIYRNEDQRRQPTTRPKEEGSLPREEEDADDVLGVPPLDMLQGLVLGALGTALPVSHRVDSGALCDAVIDAHTAAYKGATRRKIQEESGPRCVGGSRVRVVALEPAMVGGGGRGLQGSAPGPNPVCEAYHGLIFDAANTPTESMGNGSSAMAGIDSGASVLVSIGISGLVQALSGGLLEPYIDRMYGALSPRQRETGIHRQQGEPPSPEMKDGEEDSRFDLVLLTSARIPAVP